MELLKELSFKPDIIHVHDWQAALIPVYLKALYKDSLFYKNIKTAGLEDRIHGRKGNSKDVLLDFIASNSNSYCFDFIYVDGSHLLLDCYIDFDKVFSLNLYEEDAKIIKHFILK